MPRGITEDCQAIHIKWFNIYILLAMLQNVHTTFYFVIAIVAFRLPTTAKQMTGEIT